MIFPTKLPERGWLVEHPPTKTCIGIRNGGPADVPLTDEGAIRFKRKQDAENMLTILRWMPGLKYAFNDCVVTEHQWG